MAQFRPFYEVYRSVDSLKLRSTLSRPYDFIHLITDNVTVIYTRHTLGRIIRETNSIRTIKFRLMFDRFVRENSVIKNRVTIA